MIALIIASGFNPGLEALNKHYPSPMLPLVDRPFIQHVVEFLVEKGITRFEFIFSHLPEQLEALLGDGSRWGSRFSFHLAQDPQMPYDSLKTFDLNKNDAYCLLAHADRLPHFELDAGDQEFNDDPDRSTFWMEASDRNNVKDIWTGWACLPRRYLENIPPGLDEIGLEEHLLTLCPEKASQVPVSNLLSVQSYQKILESQQALLNKTFTGLFLKSREVEEGIWISRNVALHPTARVIPPVYIDEDCRIGGGTRLGPNATIGSGCILDSGCMVENAIIFPKTYVGDGLELKDVLVDKNRLINVRHDTAVSISEDFILSGVSASHLGFRFRTVISQISAGILVLLFWPFLLLTPPILKIFRRGPALFWKKAVRLPTETDNAFWKTFSLLSYTSFDQGAISKRERSPNDGIKHLFFQFMPALLAILKGDLHFVGVRPRTREEIAALNSDWRDLYLKSKPGIVTEAYINYGDFPTEDELYTSEVFYASTAGLKHDFKLFYAYIRKVFSRKKK